MESMIKCKDIISIKSKAKTKILTIKLIEMNKWNLWNKTKSLDLNLLMCYAVTESLYCFFGVIEQFGYDQDPFMFGIFSRFVLNFSNASYDISFTEHLSQSWRANALEQKEDIRMRQFFQFSGFFCLLLQ